MKDKQPLVTRRIFLASVPGLIAAGRLTALPRQEDAAREKRRELPTILSPEETSLVRTSVMAGEIPETYGHGWSCAESILRISLRLMGKSEDMGWAAAGFGGGLQHKDVCGFLSGGVMAIGLACQSAGRERSASQALCRKAVAEYWDFWPSLAPLHCRDIKTGDKDRDALVCRRIGQLAAVRLENIFRQLFV